MVLHSQTCEASGIGEEGLTLEAQGRLKGTIQDQGADSGSKKVVAPGPVSRILEARLKTRKLLNGNCWFGSMRSILALLAGFASHPCHNSGTMKVGSLGKPFEESRTGLTGVCLSKAEGSFRLL
jgi:hypothetical protein